MPGGATNVFAKVVGVPGDLVDATEHVLGLADDWRVRRVDVALVNGRGFLFSAGFGLDAAVVRHSTRHPKAKARFKQSYFAAAAVVTFAQEYLVHPPRLETEVGGRRIPGVTSIVQNGEVFTYFNAKPLHVVEGVTLDDGLLGGAVLAARRRRSTSPGSPRGSSRGASSVLRHPPGHRLGGRRRRVVRSLDGRSVPLEVDGDHIGDVTEARFSVVPAARSPSSPSRGELADVSPRLTVAAGRGPCWRTRPRQRTTSATTIRARSRPGSTGGSRPSASAPACPRRGGRPGPRGPSRSSRLRILPLGFFGSSSASTTYFGTLKPARRSRQNATSSSSAGVARRRAATTTAVTASIQRGWRIPKTAHLGDRRVLVEHLLDLAAGDVLAARS